MQIICLIKGRTENEHAWKKYLDGCSVLWFYIQRLVTGFSYSSRSLKKYNHLTTLKNVNLLFLHHRILFRPL